MNAYKLADSLDGWAEDVYGGGEQLKDAANMIRQQADRIAELEKCIEFGYKDAMDIVVLNNLGAEDNHWFVWAKKLVNIDYTAPKPIEKPLYTTPQTKPLSDEEIKLIKSVLGDYVCTLKMEIDQQKQTFKGYEHCSNIDGLTSELTDAEKAFRAIQERHGIK